VAERVDEASLTVNAPRCIVVVDLADAAVRSGRHGTFDEAVGVVHVSRPGLTTVDELADVPDNYLDERGQGCCSRTRTR
jgi:hypothetical protein